MLDERLRHVDHLRSPNITDVAVRERDVVRRVAGAVVFRWLGVGERLVAGCRVENGRRRGRRGVLGQRAQISASAGSGYRGRGRAERARTNKLTPCQIPFYV